jgi:hypothetical protein
MLLSIGFVSKFRLAYFMCGDGFWQLQRWRPVSGKWGEDGFAAKIREPRFWDQY